jgi:hypothetical protein
MLASNLIRGAAEALGVMAAFAMGGLGLAAVETWARPDADLYPSGAMAVGPENRSEDAGAESDPASADVWLVDGFNVLCAGVLGGRDRSAFWTEAGRREVLERAARFDDPDARVVVVFDGPRPAAAPAGHVPETVFAPSADAWILGALRESGRGQATVVTADRRLASRARHRGAQVVAPLAFLARCRAISS